MLKFVRVFLDCHFDAVLMIVPDQGMAYRPVFRHKGPYHLTANTALLWDPASNQRYFDLGADREVFPASTTKVLTAILVLENLPLDQVCDGKPTRDPGAANQIGFKGRRILPREGLALRAYS